MNSREMLDLVEVLASEKNVEKDVVFGVLELALASALKKSQFLVKTLTWWCTSTA